MAKLQGLLFGLATLVLVVVATFLFTKDWLPPLKSDRIAIDHALAITLVVTGLVFIVTNLLLAWFGYRYQDGPGARAAYWHDSPRLEMTWTLVTAAILAIFLFNALNLWAKVNSRPPADAVLIEVTGQQFAWNVRYPGKDGVLGKTDHLQASQDNPIGLVKDDPAAKDDLLLLNQLYLPKDRPVRVQVRSMDVIHSFFLPNFRVKQDAMPGMTIEIWFTPKETGDFEIACAEHCGLGHYRMRGQVHVVPAADLDKAVAEAAQ
ncbi:MAG TPA: cytochrome c oxidase subunit II [Vicinamibacteria bacterium]|jgi:cytochrome c oxidase subunit 2|nr:cytochrome c oxidase subunit II [Vicinamibacteria bacterium]